MAAPFKPTITVPAPEPKGASVSVTPPWLPKSNTQLFGPTKTVKPVATAPKFTFTPKPKPLRGGPAGPGKPATKSVVDLTPQEIEQQAQKHAQAMASQRAARAQIAQQAQPEALPRAQGPTGTEIVRSHAPIYAPRTAGRMLIRPTGPTGDIYSKLIVKQIARMSASDPTFAQLPPQKQEAKARAFMTAPQGQLDPTTQWGPVEQQQAAVERLKNEGLPMEILNQVAQGLMPVATAERLARGQAPTLGSVLSDVGTGAALLGPDELLAPVRAARAGLSAYRDAGISADSVRAAKAALDAQKGAKQAKSVFALDLKTNQARKSYAATLKAAGYSRQEQQSIVSAHDAAAMAMSRDLGIKPSEAWDRIYASTQYHPVPVTTEDIATGRVAFAQEGQRPEVQNLAHTPDATPEPPSPTFLKSAARRLVPAHKGALPEEFSTPTKFTKLLENLRARAVEAADYKDWYSNSAQAIVSHVGGNTAEADKLAALVAIYSPRAEVYSKTNEWNNLDRAINAYNEFHSTGEISPRWSISSHKTGEEDWQTHRAQQVMQGNFDWSGLKTNRFYRNFLQHIDPAKYEQTFGSERFGTMDTWMRRAFQYPVKGKTVTEHTLLGPTEKMVGKAQEPITPKMYSLMEKATKVVADSLGWSPEEAQAAIWTSIKAESEKTPLSQAGFDFADAFEHRAARNAAPLAPSQLELGPATTADHPLVEHVDAAIEASRHPDSGFTLTVGLRPDTSAGRYIVAYGAHELRSAAPLTRESLLSYRNEHLALLRSDPSLRIGGWHNPADRKIYLDISKVFDSHEEAMQFAHEQGQVAIFDRSTGQSVPTSLTPGAADEIKSGLRNQALAERSAGTDLQGLPAGRHSNADAQKVADSYMESRGAEYSQPTEYARVDPARAKQIAAWYDAAKSEPNDPAVRAAYDAMARETKAQYDAITRSGYKFEFYPGADPYPKGPSQAIDDLRANKHLYVFPTDSGFGTEVVTHDHPLLGDSGVKWNGKTVTHNDLFRGVHDFMGHFKEGVGFRADGEENAWRAHVAMYSDEAKPAMTAETRGQNSWVNYGPHADANRTADQAETVYADQKAVLAPSWIVHSGAGQAEQANKDFESALAEAAGMMGKRVPKNGRVGSKADRADALAWIAHQARTTNDPQVHAIADVLDQAVDARNSPDPEYFFQKDNPLLNEIADAHNRPLLSAAAMHATQSGTSVEDTAKMFGLKSEDLQKFIDSGEHAREQERILSNADVGGGAAATPGHDEIASWIKGEFDRRLAEGQPWGDVARSVQAEAGTKFGISGQEIDRAMLDAVRSEPTPTAKDVRNTVEQNTQFGGPTDERYNLLQSEGTPIKGMVARTSEGEHFLNLFQGADVSTAIHELGHAIEQYLPADLKATLGNDPETIARTFEQYFMKGGIPDEALRPAMEHIAEQMTRIYGAADSVPGAKITPEIKAAFDNFFTREITQRPAFGQRLAAAYLSQAQSGDVTKQARDLADQHGIDIQHVIGTGADGRVTVPDVEKYVFEQMPPEDQLRSLMAGLRIQRGRQEAGYSVERSARFKKAQEHFLNTSLSPEERLAAAKAELSGELPKVIVGGHAREMNQDTLDHLLGTVFSHPKLMPGQKTKVADALISLLREGRTPTTGELNLMRHVWGRETVGSLQDLASNWHKGYNLALSALNIPRSIMSSMDVSFGLRQALVAAFYDPKTWFRAWRSQFEYLSKYTGGGEAPYKAFMESIHASPNYPLYEAMGLSITDLEREIGLREEQYQSNLAEALTYKGHGPGNMIRSSGRMYTGMAVKLRTELADKLLVEAAQRGQDIHDTEWLKGLGHFINGITGRGDLPGKVLQESAPLLNSLFFSPRLLASRVQMLNPVNYIAGDKFLRRQYLRAGLRTFGSLATILGAIKLFVPGAVVGTDWRSSDFGKIRLGDTRIDLGGGFNQLFHLMGEIYTGQKINSTTGKVQSLTSNKFGQATRADAFISFFTGKLAPSPSMINDWMKNRDPQHLGQPFNWQDEAASHFQPLIAQDAWQLYNDPTGSGLNGIEAAAAGYGLEATGVGIQTYGATNLAAKPTSKLEKEAKQAGLPAPDQSILIDVQHKAQLDSITASDQGNVVQRMEDSAAYYAKATGRDDFGPITARVKAAGTNKDAEQVVAAIRHALVGPGLGEYEAAIRKYKATAPAGTK